MTGPARLRSPSSPFAFGALVVLALVTLGCDDPQPPGPATAASASASASHAPDAAPSTDGGAATTGDATVVAQPDAGADASSDVAPALYGDDGGALGQTDAFPTLDSPSYAERTRLLWEAIVRDEPEHAAAAFFPLVAYQQVKAIPNPPADYKGRLLKAFARDIHAFHKKLGPDPEKARFVALEVPVEKAKWMEPGSEGNKLGYDRVLDGKLVFTKSDGTDGSLPVKSMISWRGEWYVVHLAGFK